MLEEDLDGLRRARRRTWLRFGAFVLLLVGLAALLPIPLGHGAFAWRLFRYDRVQLHFVNVTGGDVQITIGTRSETFPSGAVHRLEFRAGDVELEAADANGDLIERHAFHTDNRSVFFNLGDNGCFAVLELTNLYNDRGGPPLRVIDRIDQDTDIYLIPEGVFVPPRGVAPERVPHGERVLWIDDVACQLLEPSEEHILIGQQLVRMEGRREERQRRLDEEESLAQ